MQTAAATKKRTPGHPSDVLSIASERALLVSSIGDGPGRHVHVIDWLQLVEREAERLLEYIDEDYPIVPFEGEAELLGAHAVACALMAIGRDLDDEERWEQNKQAAMYLCDHLGDLALRMREIRAQEKAKEEGGDEVLTAGG